MSNATIEHVRAGDRVLVEQPPTPGLTREQAFATDGRWAGIVKTAPRGVSGWHHHGDHETYIYLVSGRARVEWGPGGAEAVEGGPGSFVHVPKGLVHREVNPADEENVLVVFRVGTGAPVVPADGPDAG